MKKPIVACAAFIGILLSAGASLPARAAEPQGQNATKALSQPDQDFVRKAAQAGLAEVELSHAVQGRLMDSDLKEFAERMVNDHSKANAELTKLAQQKGMTPPSETDAAHKDKKSQLEQLSGPELDRRYLECMVKDHEEAVALFQKEAASGQDLGIKSFAQNTLPTLRDHLDRVRRIDQKLKKPQTAQRP